MLIDRQNYTIRIAVGILAAATIAFPLMAPTLVEAAENARQQAGKHKSVVKKYHQRVVKGVKLKKTKANRNDAAYKNGTIKKAAVKFDAASLTLAKNIELNPPKAAEHQVPVVTRSANLTSSKPPADETDMPLQIGKTLYQRNGEIRQLEGR